MTARRRLLIVGLGRSGVAAARLADRDGAEVWVTDLRHEDELSAELAQLPPATRRFLGGHPTSALEGVEQVVTSPGVPPDAEILEAARRRGIEIVAEVEFAWLHAPATPLVAVTGSNGKSTVTTLVGEMLSASGVDAAAGGNLGTAASELVLVGGFSCWVLEVSSFQSELLGQMRPTVAVFLNLSQDHLERHPDMASYLAAKQRMFAFQGSSDAAVLNADEPAVAETATAARRRLFSIERPADAWLDGMRLVLDGATFTERAHVALGGLHNVANALAAVLAATELGATPDAAARVLREFRGLDHRHLTVHEAGGVTWVDDSKATNVGAALAALRGYPGRSVHLILGGQAKGQDFTVMAAEVARAAVSVYVIGIDGPAIATVLADAAPIVECETLERAVRQARAAAKAGQWVLLAPACASYDQFSGYAERGRRFAELARAEVNRCR
ncbi:MAG TPA: UDP-N-acetylmuramoyl-L-alanine--D-glutamate ligase [Thermoanaerobaculales bacterium]|nr:UDP-N-acetylmuramoyl-L-alanine--D-glutamate ligase [Thermoanaerobaculales bacterium]HQN96878.1 UDP-N-acetylmuramoyl-L-alanine--D-glutamate ligase [Thermoanaerobaculales bacterium]HQP45024.1 UDP-N-acetylmuramoyl-L-alanine--D-glutamate ligase [Thermoanaerobaculales bacterium]